MTDAWALMQAEMAKRPRGNANIRVLGGTPLEGLDDIPMSPADPRWRERIPPPADPGPQQQMSPAGTPTLIAPATNIAGGDARLAIYFGRSGYNIAVERAPSWDIDGRVYPVTAASLREFLPILAKVIKIKDTTGEFYVPAPEESQGAERGVPDDRPRHAKPRTKRSQARYPAGDAATGTGDAIHRNGADSPGLRFETGDTPFPGSSIQANPAGEDSGVVTNFEDPKLREEFERALKATAYKKQVALRKEYGLDDETDARVGATGNSGG